MMKQFIYVTVETRKANVLSNNDQTNLWKHQNSLVGEHFQIYTEQGSSQVGWNTDLTKGINKPIIWFQARFHLDHLVPEDLNANPVLMEMIYSLIQSICHDKTSCCCQQAQINCLKPTQRYYHIPSDWLMAKNNLLTVFNDFGASSPRSVGLIQRVVIV